MGPKLVRGRGVGRRRSDPFHGLVLWLVPVLVAVGLILLAVRWL